jgi:hypothetical protein
MHRRIFGGLLLAASLFIAAPTVAMAATPSSAQTQVAAAPQQVGPITVPLVGTAGTNAVATITSFRVVDGVLTAVGTVTGTVVTGDLASPVTTVVTNAPFTAPITILQQAGTCRVLDLDLGPIHLDLLGLVVDLSAVSLDITAVPGAGNLLGNLLCAVAHLLDSGNTGGLTQLVNLLNQILGSL